MTLLTPLMPLPPPHCPPPALPRASSTTPSSALAVRFTPASSPRAAEPAVPSSGAVTRDRLATGATKDMSAAGAGPAASASSTSAWQL